MAPPSPFVPVDDEPLHVQRWKTDDVRLVDVQFPPHTKSLWHQHVHYGVYIAITAIHATEQSTQDPHPKQLEKKHGEVFCRDHTKDKFIHVVTTMEQPMRIIEVELVRDQRRLTVSNVNLPLHVDRCIVLLHEDDRCRVYRITLLPQSVLAAADACEISIVLPASAVLVALNDCAVSVLNPTVDDKIHADHTRELEPKQLKLTAGDDVQLVAGAFTLKATHFDADAGVASFILTEVL